MLRAGIVSGGDCLYVRLSAENLENYWSEIDVSWQPTLNARSGWKLTLTLSYFRIIRLHRVYEMQPILTDVRGVCPSHSLNRRRRVVVQCTPRAVSAGSFGAACQITLATCFIYHTSHPCTVSSFECINLATSLSVRRYVFKISKTHSLVGSVVKSLSCAC